MAWTKVGVGTEETDREMDGWWERKDHPLLNDVILSTLFEFIEGEDLEECRLVCKKWCELTLSAARSKFKVNIYGNNSEEMTKSLTDFVEVFKQNKLGIPFFEYNMNPFCAREGPGQEFLQISGSTARTIYLRKDNSDVSTFKVEDISELLKAMPNIEEVHIYESIYSQSGDVVKLFPDSSTKPTLNFLKTLILSEADETSKYCPTFFEEILSIAPNITEFHVDYSTDEDPNINQVKQILEAIAKFERESVSVIRNIYFVNPMNEHMEILDRESQKENSLKFLPELANLFKNSIERLYVDEVFSSFIQLPHMSKLESLNVRITLDFDSKSVKLNELFPSLKELVLYYPEDDAPELEELLPNSDPCLNVKSFSLGSVLMKIQVFNHILNIFPKLTKFELFVKTDGVEILRKIMTQMTQLEDLSVWGTIEGIESIDAFFAGIADQNVEELENVVSELKEMTVQPRADTIRRYRERYCQFPSIANLTRRRRYSKTGTGISDDGENEPTRESRMTDVFLYFGLYSMKHINKLEIGKCEFTKTSCEILTTEMGLETWTFQGKNSRDIILPNEDY